jgi:hypothetical protein
MSLSGFFAEGMLSYPRSLRRHRIVGRVWRPGVTQPHLGRRHARQTFLCLRTRRQVAFRLGTAVLSEPRFLRRSERCRCAVAVELVQVLVLSWCILRATYSVLPTFGGTRCLQNSPRCMVSRSSLPVSGDLWRLLQPVRAVFPKSHTGC